MKLLKILIIIFFIGLASCSKVSFDKNQTVVVGTFNIEWLGDGVGDRLMRNERDYQRLASVIINTGADILGLQEIENEDALKRVMKYLPDYKYIMGSTGYIQNPAIVFKKEVKVEFIENYEPLAVVKNKTRAGLVISAKKGNFDWIMMVVHLKSTSRYDSTQEMRFASYDMRKQQAEVLRNWADSIVNNSTEQDIIIVGDFNDNPIRPKSKNMVPLVDDGQFIFLTQDNKSCVNPNWDLIDHIVVNQSAATRYYANSQFIYNIQYAYTKSEIEKISDHCPVVVAFDIIMPDND
ncbi:MAG: endonuclease/exonuclease/phosphatase family protein [Candidatus Kapabacteria bacterium]|nr:endonuclease/exonuclease/phosphatase family protein [Ignavibacteriota bacterium]MCW5885690.1 endonuclease/exonuclease/phosphatase family protein [Candidatus Kapabacteria bacterium]